MVTGSVISFDCLGDKHFGVVTRLEPAGDSVKVHFKDEDGSTHWMLEEEVKEEKEQDVPERRAFWR